MEDVAAELVNIILRDLHFLLKGKNIKEYFENIERE